MANEPNDPTDLDETFSQVVLIIFLAILALGIALTISSYIPI